MNHRKRLGPVAVFFAVITAVLTVLAILTVSTARADQALANRFAEVTQIRYALEADGGRFLQEMDHYLDGNGELPEGCSADADGWKYVLEKEGYRLTIVLSDRDGGYEIRKWKISKIWEEANPMEDLWPGL